MAARQPAVSGGPVRASDRVRKRPVVSRTVRLATRDKIAAAHSSREILRWTLTRVMMAHNTVIEQDVYAEVKRALLWFDA